MNKEEACKYFDDIKPKHLAKFDAKTPEGHNIKGYICKKPNFYLGSLLITCLDGEEVTQFVQSFPKIHYYDKKDVTLNPNEEIYSAYEKLDGSNIILYGLKDKEGKLIEIIPKTRNTPVADKHLYELYRFNVDKKGIIRFFDEYPNNSIMFELYGVGNQHEVIYPTVYINMALIGCYDVDKGFLDSDDLEYIGFDYGFRTPYPMFSLWSYPNGTWELVNEKLSPLAINYMDFSGVNFPTLFDLILYIRDMLQKVNQEYAENNYGHIAIEGVVINGKDLNDKQIYIKVKPPEIEEKHRQSDTIRRNVIIKECYKYFDEYGSQVKDLYNEDSNHYVNYIMANLEEEYPKELVQSSKVRKRITNCFFDVWETRKVPESLQLLCEQTVQEYPGYSTGELMGIFMKEHPEMKRQNKSIYRVMNAINSR